MKLQSQSSWKRWDVCQLFKSEAADLALSKPVVLQEVLGENNETKACFVKDNDIHSNASHYTLLFCRALYPELSHSINSSGIVSKKKKKPTTFFSLNVELGVAKNESKEASLSIHSGAESLVGEIVSSQSPLQLFMGGARIFPETHIPKCMLEVYNYFSKM